MQRGLTYSVPLKAKLRLSCNDEEHVDFPNYSSGCVSWEISIHDHKGTFMINGAERVLFLNYTDLREYF
jgi:DNA-directed RNA polymerase subunit beta